MYTWVVPLEPIFISALCCIDTYLRPLAILVDHSLSGDNTVCCQYAKDRKATPGVLGKPNQYTVLTPGCQRATRGRTLDVGILDAGVARYHSI